MSDENTRKSLDWSELFDSGFRGEEPEDLKNKCLQICKDYLVGVWLEVSKDDIILKRITGGLTNQLYYIGLTPNIQTIGNEPKEVAIKFYGEKHTLALTGSGSDRFNDTIIGALLTENKLCPKTYGLFRDGLLMKYYKNRQFQMEAQSDPKLVKEVAQKLAKFHSLEVPIKKNNNLIFETITDYHENAYKLFPIDDLISDCECVTLKSVDLKSEIAWVTELGKHANSPIVFTHFDFRGSNILIINDDDNDSVLNQSRIQLIDYEYSDYYNRGVDFATIFNEWGRPLSQWIDLKEFPTYSVLKPFISAYIEESVNIYGSDYREDAKNSFEHIVYETMVFILVKYIYFVAIFIRVNFQGSDIALFGDKKQNMRMADKFLKVYLSLKQQFLEKN